MATPNKDGLDIHGLYQPVTDWDAIPQYPLMAVKATEGGSFQQPSAVNYFQNFRRRNFKYRGAYHWLRPDSTARAQVDNLARFWSNVGGMRDGEFIQLDWERTKDAKTGINLPDPPLALVNEWLRLAEERWPGRIIVYCSDWMTGFLQWRREHPNYPLWYANYNTGTLSTSGWAECSRYGAHVWQWTSSAIVPGISKRCDMNHVFDWAMLDRLTNQVAPPPTPTPPPPTTVTSPDTYPPGSEKTLIPIDYGVAGTDWWWTELAITPKGLQWSAPPSSGGSAQNAKIREIFLAVPLPRAPRLQNDGDVINLMQTIGTFGPCPSSFTLNDGLRDAWAANINPGR